MFTLDTYDIACYAKGKRAGRTDGKESKEGSRHLSLDFLILCSPILQLLTDFLPLIDQYLAPFFFQSTLTSFLAKLIKAFMQHDTATKMFDYGYHVIRNQTILKSVPYPFQFTYCNYELLGAGVPAKIL